MKRISIIVLTIALAITLCACGMSNDDATSGTPDTTIMPDVIPDIIPDIETNIPDPDVDTQMPIYTDGTENTDATNFTTK